MEKQLPNTCNFSDVRSAIIESARIRRQEYINVNYFRAPDSTIRLHIIAASIDDPRYTDQQRVEARQQLDAINQRQKEIIESLPSIEAGASVGERFAAFCDNPDFRTLDLSRSEHLGGDWTAADNMRSELGNLLQVVGLYFGVAKHELSPKNCTMNFHAISDGALESGLLWLTRNTKKAVIDDDQTNENIFINKRSEFIFDLSKIESELADFIKQKIQEHVSGNSYMVEPELFGIINELVEMRSDPLTPIHSTLYAYRETPTEDRSQPKFSNVLHEQTPTGGFKFATLRDEWVSLHADGIDPRNSDRQPSFV